GEPVALAAERAVAIEDERPRLVALDETADLGHVGDVLRRRYARPRRDVARSRDVADGELAMRASVEHQRAAVLQQLSDLLRRDVGGLGRVSDDRLEDAAGRLGAGRKSPGDADQQRQARPAHGLSLAHASPPCGQSVPNKSAARTRSPNRAPTPRT